LRKRPKTEILKEVSRKRLGSEFHVNGPATANARLSYVIQPESADKPVFFSQIQPITQTTVTYE